MTTDGRSVVIAARVTEPTVLTVAYNRYNILISRGEKEWTLVNATISLDDGTRYSTGEKLLNSTIS